MPVVWERVELCYKDSWKVDDLFDHRTSQVITNVCDANAFPPGFLIPHLLAAASHCSNKSRVLAWKQQCEPGIWYNSVVGYTSTNKSCPLSMVKHALRNLEELIGKSAENSSLNQCEYCNKLILGHTQ